MAITAEELRILVRAETKQAQREMRNFRRSSKDTKTELRDLAKSLIGPLSITAGVALFAKGVKDFLQTGVKFNMQLEQLHVSFKTLLGSGTAATAMLSDLKTFAATTPLQLGNLAEGAQRLIAFGTAADDVIEKMTNLGNAAMGNQQKMDRLIDAYGKVQAKGRASLEELNRFTEAGVPLMEALAENLEMTNEELFKFVSEGKVGFEDVDRALESLTTGEGQFAGMLAEQSQTLSGIISTFQDNVSMLAATLTENLLPALTSVVSTLNTSINLQQIYKNVFSDDFMQLSGTSPAERYQEAAQKLVLVQEAIKGINEELKARASGEYNFGTMFTAFKFPGQLQNLVEEAEGMETVLSRMMSGMGFGGAIALGGEDPTQTGEDEGKEYGTAFMDGVKEGMWAEMTELKWALENDFFFDPKTMWGSKADINPLGLPSGETAPELPPGWEGLIGGDGMKPEDFGVPALTQSYSELADVLPSVIAGIYGVDAAIAETDSDIVDAAMNMAKFKEELWQTVGEGALQAGLQSALSTIRDMSSALAYAGENAQSMEEQLANAFDSLWNNLSSIFLSAAMSAFTHGAFELGLVFLGLAGVSAFASGISNATSRRLADQRNGSDLPEPSSVRRGTTHTGETVVINYNGDVFTGDERAATTLATVRAAGGNR